MLYLTSLHIIYRFVIEILNPIFIFFNLQINFHINLIFFILFYTKISLGYYLLNGDKSLENGHTYSYKNFAAAQTGLATMSVDSATDLTAAFTAGTVDSQKLQDEQNELLMALRDQGVKITSTTTDMLYVMLSGNSRIRIWMRLFRVVCFVFMLLYNTLLQ